MDEFITWALSPDRDVEEAFFVERLAEFSHDRRESQKRLPKTDDDEKQARARARGLNPAYEPELTEKQVKLVAAVLGESTELAMGGRDGDRPIRDMKALRFFPHLEFVTLPESAFADVSPLKELKRLRRLRLGPDPRLEDLSPIGKLEKLTSLSLTLRAYWPDPRGLDWLNGLEEIDFHGNLMILDQLRGWPGVYSASFRQIGSLPLRSVGGLPEMPALSELKVESAQSLEGIERYPNLQRLEVISACRDLPALEACRKLKWLILRTDEAWDLRPLARLPELRRIVVRTVTPRDYSPLMDAPKLRELKVECSALNAAEVAAVNATLIGWDSDYLAQEPRPLAELKFVSIVGSVTRTGLVPLICDPWPGEDDAEDWRMEREWLGRRICAAMKRLLGANRKRGAENWIVSWGGHVVVLTLESLSDAEQLPEIVEAIRHLLASAERQMRVDIKIAAGKRWTRHDDENWEKDGEDWRRDGDGSTKEEIYREHLKREEHQRKVMEFRERQYRYQLLKADGLKARPEDFADPDHPLPPKAEEEDEGKWVAAGGDAEAPPPKHFKQSYELTLSLHLTESHLIANANDEAEAGYLMGRKPEAFRASDLP